MSNFLLRITNFGMEIGAIVVFAALNGLVIYDALRLGPGVNDSGPLPGFFPFGLGLILALGLIGCLVAAIRNPDRQPFFKVSEEVEDLAKVGAPIVVSVIVMPWLGLFITSGLYLFVFMAWYGQFRWYTSLAGGIILPFLLWAVLREAFNLSMPMSVLYRMNILPI